MIFVLSVCCMCYWDSYLDVFFFFALVAEMVSRILHTFCVVRDPASTD